MSGKIITTPSGKQYGQFLVRVPWVVKVQMETWIQRSSVYRAAFLRLALIIGVMTLVDRLHLRQDGETLWE
jgi:hypothetical protein